MALTEEQTALLRQTAKRTPMGRFLRRFWYPVATAADLTDTRPTRRVRILSQTLVLFRDTSGRAALVPERCPHEGTSMLIGAVNDHGITCVTHGWFFDTEQMCSVWDDDTVWAEGYRAREHGGLYFAYLGDDEPPPLPGQELLSRTGGTRRITVHPAARGHWLLEPSAVLDPWRLHQALGPAGEEDPPYLDLAAGRSPDALWLLTPIDEDQTLVISVEFVLDAAGDQPDLDIIVMQPGRELAGIGPAERELSSSADRERNTSLERVYARLAEQVSDTSVGRNALE